MAMVTSRCPECGETIGGGHHRLVGTSQRADELNTGLPVPIHIQRPFEVHYPRRYVNRVAYRRRR